MQLFNVFPLLCTSIEDPLFSLSTDIWVLADTMDIQAFLPYKLPLKAVTLEFGVYFMIVNK